MVVPFSFSGHYGRRKKKEMKMKKTHLVGSSDLLDRGSRFLRELGIRCEPQHLHHGLLPRVKLRDPMRGLFGFLIKKNEYTRLQTMDYEMRHGINGEEDTPVFVRGTTGKRTMAS